jgi:hypothetical protein
MHATGYPKIHGLAYGFAEEMYGDWRMLEHGDNMAGFCSLVVPIPELSAGFFILTHGENSQLQDDLKWALMDRYFSTMQKASVPQPLLDFNSRAHLFVGRYGSITYCHTCQGRQPSIVLRITGNSDGTVYSRRRGQPDSISR